MLIRFTGQKKAISKGCGQCGTKRGSYKFESMTKVYLPSGVVKTFRVGKPEEITNQDDIDYLLGELNEFELDNE